MGVESWPPEYRDAVDELVSDGVKKADAISMVERVYKQRQELG